MAAALSSRAETGLSHELALGPGCEIALWPGLALALEPGHELAASVTTIVEQPLVAGFQRAVEWMEWATCSGSRGENSSASSELCGRWQGPDQ